jgi:hypothetical protein
MMIFPPPFSNAERNHVLSLCRELQ